MKALLSIVVPLLALTVLAQDQPAPIKVPQVLNRGLGMVAPTPTGLRMSPLCRMGRTRATGASGCRRWALVSSSSEK